MRQCRQNIAGVLIAMIMVTASCGTIDLYERVVSFPEMEWHSTYKPEFTFNISDTTTPHQVYVVLRHTEKYNWNNIWINLYTHTPVDSTGLQPDSTVQASAPRPADSVRMVQYELPLANKERWLGTAMGDVYEHRILITPQPVKFPRTGTYKYVIEQAMREDPLKHVLNVGLRVEKKS